MRKYAIILIVITLISILACGLVACQDKEEEYIKPIAWSKYVDEVIEIMHDSYEIGADSLGLKTSFEINRRDDGIARKQKIDIELNISLDAGNSTDKLLIRIEGETYDGEGEIFLLSADNETMYLHIYEWQYDKHSYYQYDNAPIFDVFRKILPSSLNLDGKTSELIKIFATTILTDANVNKDKSEYIFDFSLSGIFESSIIKTIEKVLNLSSGTSLENILNGISGDTAIVDAIRGAKGQIIVRVSDSKISNIQIKISDASNSEINIKNFELSASPINTVAYVPPNIDDYKNIKIGTVSINGTIRATDKYKVNTIVMYDYELNVSLDLIQLIANDWDFSAIDDENYFHFRLSHTCSSICTDFCSVELGNKLMRPQGSVLDIAFAPKDFGTHNLYISTSLKSLINEELANTIAQKGFIKAYLSDYQLFTISLPERRALRMAEKQVDSQSFSIIEKLITIFSALNLDFWQMDVNISELEAAIGSIGDSDLTTFVFNVLNEYGIEYLLIDMGSPQYDSIRTYNIRDMAIHIATLDIADGESGIKRYNNALLASNLRPSIKWEFSDGEYDNKVFVNNIYQNNSDNSAKIYSKDVPISPEELENLESGYLKYHFTDYLGNNDENNVGFAKILDVVIADYSRIGEYQEVLLKVGYPSMNVATESSANDYFDQLLYTSLKVNIKLSKLEKYTHKRVIDGDGNAITTYNTLSFNGKTYQELTQVNVTYVYSDGIKKTIAINGQIDSVLAATSALYVVTECGVKELYYYICGNKHVEILTFNEPNEIYLNVNDTKYEPNSTLYEETYKMDASITLRSIINKFKARYKYDGGEEKTINLPRSLIKINGISINKGSFEWEVIGQNSDPSIVFYREGRFIIEVDYLGQVAKYQIIITSPQDGYAKYQIVDKTVERYYFSGFPYEFKTEIINKAHGNAKSYSKLEVTIKRGKTNNKGELQYKELANELIVSDSGLFNKKPFVNGSIVELDGMLISPIEFNFKVLFDASGYYEISINLNNQNDKTIKCIRTMYIEVKTPA